VYSHFGFNLKITDMQAAIGCRQLDKLPTFIDARRHNWNYLREGLKGLEDKLILPEPVENSNPSWFGFLITVREGLDAVKILRFLEEKGIQTRRLFGGNLLKHPCFTNMSREDEWYRVIGDLHNTNRIMRDTFWIGVYPGMTDEKLDYMISMIKEALT
jgi:CDP-6-deoxy-D-xylo-4-hexulose-3-dehydrase